MYGHKNICFEGAPIFRIRRAFDQRGAFHSRNRATHLHFVLRRVRDQIGIFYLVLLSEDHGHMPLLKRIELAADCASPDQMKRLNYVKWEMLDESALDGDK
jgi:hypothetical protein